MARPSQRSFRAWLREGAGRAGRRATSDEKENEGRKTSVENTCRQDLYQVLQVSPQAHPLIVAKAFRLLAALYHPDNKQTGDAEAFRRVTEAYRVLSDPVQRAAYHKQYVGSLVPRFGSAAGAETDSALPSGRQLDERELRPQLLRALYDVRRGRPHKPGLSLMVLAELFGCSIDDLQFTLWYLRGKRFIDVTDDADILITVAGVDHLEENGLAGTGMAGHGAERTPSLPPPQDLPEESALALAGSRNGSGSHGYPRNGDAPAAGE